MSQKLTEPDVPPVRASDADLSSGPQRTELKVELALVLLAAVCLAAGITMWLLDVERPGRIVEEPTVSPREDCYFDENELVLVAPYEVRGRNDGEVWLRVRAHVSGPSSPVVGTGAMRSPDGAYTMRGDVEVSLPGAADLDSLSCRFTAEAWE